MEQKLTKNGLELTFCLPSFEDGYYRGTRFDHSGIFRKIVFNGFVLADEWFDKYVDNRNLKRGDKNEFWTDEDVLLSVVKVAGDHHDFNLVESV